MGELGFNNGGSSVRNDPRGAIYSLLVTEDGPCPLGYIAALLPELSDEELDGEITKMKEDGIVDFGTEGVELVHQSEKNDDIVEGADDCAGQHNSSIEQSKEVENSNLFSSMTDSEVEDYFAALFSHDGMTSAPVSTSKSSAVQPDGSSDAAKCDRAELENDVDWLLDGDAGTTYSFNSQIKRLALPIPNETLIFCNEHGIETVQQLLEANPNCYPRFGSVAREKLVQHLREHAIHLFAMPSWATCATPWRREYAPFVFFLQPGWRTLLLLSNGSWMQSQRSPLFQWLFTAIQFVCGWSCRLNCQCRHFCFRPSRARDSSFTRTWHLLGKRIDGADR